ncbi:MAG: class I tRNA ligase family protein [Patescibacteria group bacterium]
MYDHKNFDKKWQDRWEQAGIFHAKDDSDDPKYYLLIEFPYPSGAGLHIGHPRSYTALDVIARKRRMEGYNVLYPIGWDAFGLPTENYAIKTGRKPQDVTAENIATFKQQLQSLGISFDWSREVNTTDPAYFKWTQWQFLQFFKAGLAYKDKMPINWCLSCKIGLANEEVVDGKCERCGGEVEKRDKEQWMIAITKYADRLLEDLGDVDYLDKIKKQQADWIGRSEGAEVIFKLDGHSDDLTVFTTRPDTLFGVTYMVLAPEHDLVEKITTADQKPAVHKYVKEAVEKTDIERGDVEKEKTGVFTGAYAINPVNNEKIPIWVADYVMMSYGTGAIMAVPAHDERDFAFATKFDLPIRQVVRAEGSWLIIEKSLPKGAEAELKKFGQVEVEKVDEDWGKFYRVTCSGEKEDQLVEYFKENLLTTSDDGGAWYADSRTTNKIALKGKEFEVWDKAGLENFKEYGRSVNIPEEQLDVVPEAFSGDGVAVNSGEFDGLETAEFKKQITAWLEEKDIGKAAVNYKLRDWVFSRQRYWGEPIPLINCEKCGWVAVPDGELPVKLPDIEKYEPTDSGESPLAAVEDWVKTVCPECGGPAERETDTMPNWAGSSWYFLRYIDPHNNKVFADPDKLKYWMPVDWYNGGMEHTTLHLLYSRFWNKFLHDQGHVPVSEPYAKRTSHGLILAEDGRKMSKSLGNVVNPDEIVNDFGADTLRVYEMFIGPFAEAVPWSTNGVSGVKRFLDKVVRLSDKIIDKESAKVTRSLNQTIKKVSGDIEKMHFNTAVAQMMTFVNDVNDGGGIEKEHLVAFLQILCPFAPHVANEVYEKIGESGFVEEMAWPEYNEELIAEPEVEIAIQINGKLRGTITVEAGTSEEEVIKLARAEENVVKYLVAEPKKTIYVEGKLVSFVI